MKKTTLIAAGLLAAVGASAQTIIDNLAQQDAWTNAWFAGAQIMQAPEAVLQDFRFLMSPNTTIGSVQFRVETVAGGEPSGTVIFSDTTVVPGGGGLIEFNGINVGLTAGTEYAFVIDLLGASGESFGYTASDTIQGSGSWFDTTNGWFNFSGLDQAIYASFVPEPATFVVLGFGVLGLAALRRRK
jgi:hypothetical protein